MMVKNTLKDKYKKTGGNSVIIETALAIYDNYKLIFKTGEISEENIIKFVEYINEKYGFNLKVVKK